MSADELRFLGTIRTSHTFFFLSYTKWSSATNSHIDGAWERISGQPLPKGARDITILSGGHFIFTAYDAQTFDPKRTWSAIGFEAG
jgi:hypothetical protein